MIQSDSQEREGRRRADSPADFRQIAGDTARSLAGPVVRLWRNWKQRQDISALRDLDERLLNDIGLTPADVREALNLPLGENASRMLAGRALRSRQAWRWLGRH